VRLDEARRLVAAEEQIQRARLSVYRAQVFAPYWGQGYKTIAGTAYLLGPIHGPKLTWAMIRARAGERREEAQVLALRGLGVREIAERLCVTPGTARKYLAPPPPPPPPTPLWLLPRAERLAERAQRRRLGMLAWAASRPPLRVFADNVLTDPGFIAAYHAKYTPGFPADGGR
jgi:hypothetical protein